MFSKIYARLEVVEGGFVNHPNDRGGMTIAGISRTFHPSWPGWAMVDERLRMNEDPDSLLKIGWFQALIKKFYRREFWDALRLEHLPEVIAAEIFDSAVNCGKQQSVLWLQHAMNLLSSSGSILVEDGVLGPRTLVKVQARCSNYGCNDLLKALNGQQYGHYQQLVEQDPSQRVFFKGWLTRVWEEAIS